MRTVTLLVVTTLLSGCAYCRAHRGRCETIAFVGASIVAAGFVARDFNRGSSVIGDCTVSPLGVQNPCPERSR